MSDLLNQLLNNQMEYLSFAKDQMFISLFKMQKWDWSGVINKVSQNWDAKIKIFLLRGYLRQELSRENKTVQKWIQRVERCYI